MMRLYREVYSAHAPKRSRGFKELSDTIKSDGCRLGKVGVLLSCQFAYRVGREPDLEHQDFSTHVGA